MSATKYTYSISTGTANGVMAPDALAEEIRSSAIVTALDHISTSGDTLEVWFKAALSATDQTNLTLVVTAHEGIPIEAPPQKVQVIEEFKGTQGHYQTQSFDMTIDQAQGTWKTMVVSWPYATSVFSAKWIHTDNMEGDEIQVLVAPDTVIGAITADVAVSGTEIDVQDSVIEYMQMGYKAKLYDGVNQDDLGRALNINAVDKKITFETQTENAFLASSPTYVQLTTEMIPHLMLRGRYQYKIGEDVIGGSYIPANTPVHVRYKNNQGDTANKVFSFVVEYKY